MKKTFDWTQQTRELLFRLLDKISEATKAWTRFNSLDGDIGYFSGPSPNPSGSQHHRSLRAIKETFEMLEDLQQKLELLDKSCNNSAQAVSQLST